MSAVVDLCNRALSLVGADRIASLDEASPEARECKLWWTPVRQQVFRGAFWNSLRKRTELSLRSSSLGNWAYSYTYPPDCLHARFIEDQDNRYPVFVVAVEPVTGGYDKVILTNASEAVLWYTYDSEDPSTWDSLLEQTVVDALAGSIAMGLTGKTSLRLDLFQKANASIMQARAAAAQELRIDMTWKPEKLAAMDDWTDLVIESSPYVVADGPLFQ